MTTDGLASDATAARECFIATLRSARKAQGISARELSERIGAYRTYVGHVESRSEFPSPSRIEKLAVALGAPPEEWTRIAAPLTSLIREEKARRGRERGRANGGLPANHEEMEEARRVARETRGPADEIAKRFGVSLATVHRWRGWRVSPSQRSQNARVALRASQLRRVDRARSKLTAARVALRMNVVELSARTRIPASVICALETGSRSPVTLDGQWSAAAKAIASHLGFTCGELWPAHAPKEPRLPIAAAPTPEELCAERQSRELLVGAVASLPPRHALVIRLRFGLCSDDDGADHATVGEAIGGRSRQRVRQIEHEALRMLAAQLGGAK